MKTTKSVGILFAVITFLIIVVTVIISSRLKQQTNEFTYRIIEVDSMYWGYEILKGDKVFIHQELIPALPGQNHFSSKADARKVAELLVYRLNHKLQPGISKKDLQELQISKE